MNRTPRLSVSGIPYLTHVWNFMSGCENYERGICPINHCWARSLTERFPDHYPNGFKPTIYPEAFLSPLRLKKPARIGVVFMGDLFGDWVDPGTKMESPLPSGIGTIKMSLKGWVLTTIERCPQHTFIFLTKCPQNLIKWSPFPENCYIGVSATDDKMFTEAIVHLQQIKATVKFISFEPLLGQVGKFHYLPLMLKDTISWVILGSQTQPVRHPQRAWVEEIIAAADKAGIPIFVKEPLATHLNIHRQEFPKGSITEGG